MTLNDICYEQIKDTFWYGIYGDFKLVIDKSTGCFNATKLCNNTGKEFKQWMRMKHTQELIAYTKSCRGNSPGNFYEPKGLSNNNECDKQITGQYVCEDLLLSLANWISPEFYCKCNKIIINYFAKENPNIQEVEENMSKLKLYNEEQTKLLVQKDDEISDLKKMLVAMDAKMDTESAKAELRHRNMEERLTVSTIDRVPKSQDTDLRERFVVLKHKEGEYYVIRGQDKYCINKVKAQTDLDPSIATIIDLAYQPNSRNLFIRLKELQDDKFFINGNYIETKHEEELIKVLGRLNEEKYNI